MLFVRHVSQGQGSVRSQVKKCLNSFAVAGSVNRQDGVGGGLLFLTRVYYIPFYFSLKLDIPKNNLSMKESNPAQRSPANNWDQV